MSHAMSAARTLVGGRGAVAPPARQSHRVGDLFVKNLPDT
jgi:hypothetical protein